MDIEGISSRLGIHRADVLDLVHLFVETSQRDLEKIRRGVAENMPADAASAAHSIKGAAGNLGFDDISDIARAMEMKGKEGRLEGFDTYMTDLEALLERLREQLRKI